MKILDFHSTLEGTFHSIALLVKVELNQFARIVLPLVSLWRVHEAKFLKPNVGCVGERYKSVKPLGNYRLRSQQYARAITESQYDTSESQSQTVARDKRGNCGAFLQDSQRSVLLAMQLLQRNANLFELLFWCTFLIAYFSLVSYFRSSLFLVSFKVS